MSSLFKDILSSDESLFKDTIALDYDYIPKLVPYREPHQRHLALCIKPLFASRNGKNLFMYGNPGLGKTVVIRHVLRDLEEQTDEIDPIYINCWQKNTSYKVFLEMCHEVGYRFTQNKKTDELFAVLRDIMNKKSVVLVFDEIDKAEDYDFLYTLLEEVYRKTIVLVTNYKNWLDQLDERIRSRLLPDLLPFTAYTKEQIKGILTERRKYAFVPGVWDEKAFDMICEKVYPMQDMRTGLYLMKEAGDFAELRSSRNITLEDVKKAINKLDQYSIKSSTDLDPESVMILGIVKKNSQKKIGDLFAIYQKKGGRTAYKTFQRKIEKLKLGKFVSVEKTQGGAEGNTTIVTYNEIRKKLTDY